MGDKEAVLGPIAAVSIPDLADFLDWLRRTSTCMRCALPVFESVPVRIGDKHIGQLCSGCARLGIHCEHLTRESE